MEHLVSPASFLNNIRDIIKNDGIVIIGVPNIFSFFKSSWYNPVHLNYYTKKTLKYSIKSMGFEVLEIFYYPPKGIKVLKSVSQFFPFFSNTLYVVAKKDLHAKEEKISMLTHQAKKEELNELFK